MELELGMVRDLVVGISVVSAKPGFVHRPLRCLLLPRVASDCKKNVPNRIKVFVSDTTESPIIFEDNVTLSIQNDTIVLHMGAALWYYDIKQSQPKTIPVTIHLGYFKNNLNLKTIPVTILLVYSLVTLHNIISAFPIKVHPEKCYFFYIIKKYQEFVDRYRE